MIIGLDCGGAKTAGAICDRQGRILARARAQGAAIVGAPGERFFATITGLLDTLCGDAGATLADIEHVAIGLSGVDFADEQAEQQAAIAHRYGLESRLTLVNDGIVALCGVSPAARLVLVQLGTGLTSAYRAEPGGETVHDSLDVGRIYDVRDAAIALAARMIDGRADPTPFLDAVLAYCGVPAADFAAWYLRSVEAAARRTGMARIVFSAWRQGDPAATDMVHAAARDYALIAKVMGDRLPGEAHFATAFGGGTILEGQADFQRLLCKELAAICPRADMTGIRLSPEFGAVLLAARPWGGDPAALFETLAAQDNGTKTEVPV